MKPGFVERRLFCPAADQRFRSQPRRFLRRLHSSFVTNAMATSGLPTGQLGQDGPRVTKLGFGAMGLSGMLDPRSHFTLDPSSFGRSCYASQNLRRYLAQPCYMAIKSPMSSASKCWTSSTSSVVASSIHRTHMVITRNCLASGSSEVASEMRWV